MRGLSLLEMVVALGLLALVLPFLLNLVPSSALALKRAEDVDAASAYATRLLEEARATPPSRLGVDLDSFVTLNNTRFRVVREVYAVDNYPALRDVVVAISGPARLQPIRMATRLGSE
ncbi:MAG: hypothetical protein AMXMBFR33_45430 [Candidatus Xenobia bacterium]